MTTRVCALIYLNFVKYGCGLLSFHVIWVLALPAQETSSQRTSSRNGKDDKPFELKGVTSQDEDVQLGILVFALMVVCIAVSLALAVTSCLLKARTRQRDEMEARVEELQYILSAKVEEMRVHGALQVDANNAHDQETEQGTISSRGLNENTAQVTQKADREQSEPLSSCTVPSVSAPAAVLSRMYVRDSTLATTHQPVHLPASAPSYDHSGDAALRMYVQQRALAIPAHQVPLPPSIPFYDHSQGEAFTSSPEVFATPMNDPMPSYERTPHDPRLTQEASSVVEREEHCPPNVAWLTDVIVESPAPESARPAKHAD